MIPVLAAALAAPAHAAPVSALVTAAPRMAAVVRAAGGTPLARPLRVWRVPLSSVPRLRRLHAVVFVERERILPRTGGALDEPLAADEWWRPVIGADAAPAPGPGKPVTIVDSGLDITHEEFAARPNTTLLNTQTTSLGDDDHGTEVASVAGAPVNGRGIAGVYPEAVLRSWDASPSGFITTGAAVRGITRAAQLGPGVINISFGGDIDDPLIRRSILYAVRVGSLVVAASGNDGLDGSPLSYPASYPHVLTIGATDPSGAVTDWSSRSRNVDLAAPGAHIRVAEPVADDPVGYEFASGTSFSAPMVTAASAWVWSVRPELDNTQLFDVMRMSARDIGPAGYDPATGFGMLDIPSALAFAAPPPDPSEPNDNVDQVVPDALFATGQRAILTPSRTNVTFAARVDRHEDPNDVYRAFVPAHGTLRAQTSGGAVDLRVFRPGARSISDRPLAVSTRAGTSPDSVVVRNPLARGAFLFVDVRPGARVPRATYTLRVSASARR